MLVVLSTASILDGLLSPPILFFMLGLAAALMKSDLTIPEPVSRLLSIYLLVAIGFRGGVELSHGGLGSAGMWTLPIVVLSAGLIPVWCFFILRLRLDAANAAAIAATYGSVSAVTFVTAIGLLTTLGVPFSGFMVAGMALMESPAIIVGILLLRRFGTTDLAEHGTHGIIWKELFREACLNGAVVLLLGSLVIGMITGDSGWAAMGPVIDAPFKGLLCFFLLDMGLLAARQLDGLRQTGKFLVGFAIIAAVLHAGMGIVTARILNLGPGDALLLTVLFASASYIAVPAAMRIAIPEANAGLYLPMSLGLTFPFNIAVGVPLYFGVIQLIW